jgi:hypothetical protein
MWPYLKNPLRFVVSWPHTKKSFSISVNLNFCQKFPLVDLFYLSIRFHLSISSLVSVANPLAFDDRYRH